MPVRTARSNYRCLHCGKRIEKGTKYFYLPSMEEEMTSDLEDGDELLEVDQQPPYPGKYCGQECVGLAQFAPVTDN